MNTVLVIGATGKTGSALLDLLRARAEPVRPASRTPAAADAIRFDWDDIATHGPALDGVDRVYLVPPPSAVDPVPVVEPFLAEARRRRIRRLVMLGSAIEFPHAPGRLELAARVRAEPGWLVLSPSGFMQNFLRPHPVGTAIHDHGEIATSAGSGRMSWIDARDVAASAAAALTRPLLDEQLPNDFVLTGPRGLSNIEIAALIAAQAGRSVQVKDLTVDELTAHYRAAGLPAGFGRRSCRSLRRGNHLGARPHRASAPHLRRLRPRTRRRMAAVRHDERLILHRTYGCEYRRMATCRAWLM